MDFDDLIRQIEGLKALVTQHHADAFACENISRDLMTLTARLRSGEYANTDFSSRNPLDVQRRVREYFNYWRGYRAHAEAWAKRLAVLPWREAACIIDLCPGWAPKIELALYLLGYQGRVLIYDRWADSAAVLREWLALFRPQFELQADIRDIFVDVKPQASLVLSNHMLDDVLVDDYCKRQGLELRTLYEDELRWAEVTQHILRAGVPADFIKKLARHLSGFVLDQGYLLSSYYPSLLERGLNLTEWTAFCQSMHHDLQRELLQLAYKDQTSLLTESDAGIWVLQKG